MLHRIRNSKAFSLLEVVVVLIIITVVALLAAPQLFGPLTQSESVTAELQAEQAIRTASSDSSLRGGSVALTVDGTEGGDPVAYTSEAEAALTEALSAVEEDNEWTVGENSFNLVNDGDGSFLRVVIADVNGSAYEVFFPHEDNDNPVDFDTEASDTNRIGLTEGLEEADQPIGFVDES